MLIVNDWVSCWSHRVIGAACQHNYVYYYFLTLGSNSQGRKKLDTNNMSSVDLQSHRQVGSHRRSSDGAEWSCVAGLKPRCSGRERCCPCRHQRQPRFSDRDRPEKSNPRRRMGPEIPPQGVGKCTLLPGPGAWLFYYYYLFIIILNNIVLVSGWRVLLLTAVASAAYEKACVLFSIAAMQTQVANIQDMKTDDGLKMAAKLFQVGWSAETDAKQSLNIYLSIVCFQ